MSSLVRDQRVQRHAAHDGFYQNGHYYSINRKLLWRVPASLKMNAGVGTALPRIANFKRIREVVQDSIGKSLKWTAGKGQSAAEGQIAGAMNKKPPKPKAKGLKREDYDQPLYDQQDIQCLHNVILAMKIEL